MTYLFVAFTVSIGLYMVSVEKIRAAKNKEPDCPMACFVITGCTCCCCAPCLWLCLCFGARPRLDLSHKPPRALEMNLLIVCVWPGSAPIFKRAPQKQTPQMPTQPGPAEFEGGVVNPLAGAQAGMTAQPIPTQQVAVAAVPTTAPTTVTITVPPGLGPGMQMQ